MKTRTTSLPYRVLSDATRVRVLDALCAKPQSVRELAKREGKAADRLYYHLRKLEEAGLVRVLELKPLPGGKVERVYGPSAQLPAGDATSPAEIERSLHASLAATQVDLRAAFARRTRREHRVVSLTRTTLRLKADRFRELTDRLNGLFDEFKDEPTAGTVSTRALFALIQLGPE